MSKFALHCWLEGSICEIKRAAAAAGVSPAVSCYTKHSHNIGTRGGQGELSSVYIFRAECAHMKSENLLLSM
jgi:hypothetical protein